MEINFRYLKKKRDQFESKYEITWSSKQMQTRRAFIGWTTFMW